MRRREFIAGLAGAWAWPLAARAQRAAMPVIGLLLSTSREANLGRLAAFREGLSRTGYVEMRNVAIEYRSADGQYERLPALAAELVRRQVNVIVAGPGIPAALAAKSATTTIPIVFQSGADPVVTGLVTNLAQPGGNMTGVTNLDAQLGPKQLEILHELIPMATSIALLVNPANPASETESKNMQTAARTLGLQLPLTHATTDSDLDLVFANLNRLPAGGLVIAPDPFFGSRIERLAALATRHAVPTIYRPDFAAAGGLMGLAAPVAEQWRLVGAYAGRILKGDRPGGLPVQQSTRVELTINTKAAKVLGLTVPAGLLSRADKVIE
jgi:putative tryptophan/tyrosine transport system substrate-binding protein